MITEQDVERVMERDYVHVLRLHAWERANRQLQLAWCERWILWPGSVLLACAAIWEVARWS